MSTPQTSAHRSRSVRKSAAAHRPNRRRAGMKSSRSSASNAIELLKADHKQVKSWFEAFLSARGEGRKRELVQKILLALKVHTQIEAEIFYPAFLEATGEEDIHNEAEVEHEAATKLITEIEGSRPTDDHYHAKVKVLSEMIKHHVNEEEKSGGMFSKARQSKMDLQGLGERLSARKNELMSEAPQQLRPEA